jgi:hypothetical protein
MAAILIVFFGTNLHPIPAENPAMMDAVKAVGEGES